LVRRFSPTFCFLPFCYGYGVHTENIVGHRAGAAYSMWFSPPFFPLRRRFPFLPRFRPIMIARRKSPFDYHLRSSFSFSLFVFFPFAPFHRGVRFMEGRSQESFPSSFSFGRRFLFLSSPPRVFRQLTVRKEPPLTSLCFLGSFFLLLSQALQLVGGDGSPGSHFLPPPNR